MRPALTVRFPRTLEVRPFCTPVREGCSGRGPGTGRPARAGTSALPLSGQSPSHPGLAEEPFPAGSLWRKKAFLRVPSATCFHFRGAGPQDCQTSIGIIRVQQPHRDRFTLPGLHEGSSRCLSTGQPLNCHRGRWFTLSVLPETCLPPSEHQFPPFPTGGSVALLPPSEHHFPPFPTGGLPPSEHHLFLPEAGLPSYRQASTVCLVLTSTWGLVALLPPSEHPPGPTASFHLFRTLLPPPCTFAYRKIGCPLTAK